jgi:hypothetical protein
VIHSVLIEPDREPRLVASGIDVRGRADLAPIVAWLGPQVPEWRLRVDDTGRIVGRHHARALTIEVEPWVEHDLLHFRVSTFRWHRLRLPVPRRLRRPAPVAFPPLAEGVSVVAARRREREVEFRLRIASIRQELDLPRLRDAILRGGRLTLP